MGGKLGVSGIQSGEDLASLVERRLPAADIKALVPCPTLRSISWSCPTGPWQTESLNISHSCRDHSRLPIHSVCETDDTPLNPSLAGKAPVEMRATEARARVVEEMIVQIDHGIFA
jgi:hypothetical protein